MASCAAKMHALLDGVANYTFTDTQFIIPNGATTLRIWTDKPVSPAWADCVFGEFDSTFCRVYPDPSTDCDGIPCACVEAAIYVRRRYKLML